MQHSKQNKPSVVDECEHQWLPHFHELIDKTPTTMRVGVCILCEKCGMFRTKVLEFRFQNEIPSI